MLDRFLFSSRSTLDCGQLFGDLYHREQLSGSREPLLITADCAAFTGLIRHQINNPNNLSDLFPI